MVVSHLIYLPLALKREKIYHISEPFRKHSYFLSSLIFLAGIPAIVQSGSLIECTTTALAPMVTSLAIFISPITIAPAPISTLLPITGQQPIMWSSPPLITYYAVAMKFTILSYFRPVVYHIVAVVDHQPFPNFCGADV